MTARFHVPIETLKKRLATAYDSERLDIRSDAQIKAVGEQVKSDLVTALARLSQQLANQDELTLRDAPALDRLISSAAKLFAWPSPKPVDAGSNALMSSNGNAINLALIRTSPEQLKQLSQSSERMLDAEELSHVQAVDGE